MRRFLSVAVSTVVVAARTLWQGALFALIAAAVTVAVVRQPTRSPLDVVLPGAVLVAAAAILAIDLKNFLVALRNAAVLRLAIGVGSRAAAGSVLEGATGILLDAGGRELGRAVATDHGRLFQIVLPRGGTPAEMIVKTRSGQMLVVPSLDVPWMDPGPGGAYSIRVGTVEI